MPKAVFATQYIIPKNIKSARVLNVDFMNLLFIPIKCYDSRTKYVYAHICNGKPGYRSGLYRGAVIA
jgi:hypothetical protein